MGNPSKLVSAGAFALASVLCSCASGAPGVSGAAGTSPAPNVAWTPPARAVATEAPVQAVPAGAIPPDLAQRVNALTLADVVDLALQNNPATRASWNQARAAQDILGSTEGAFYPTITGLVSGSRTKSPATAARSAGIRTDYGPSVALNYLLLDFGGRSGSVERARNNLMAADFTHNATLQNTVLQAESAYFTYMATSALLTAERAAEAEAQANYTAAQRRNTVGLATIADVLQARTALAQEQLNRETIEGNLQSARGALAVALGLPANLPFEMQPLQATLPVRAIAMSVDSIINEALLNRPDLAAARAQAAAAAAQIRVARSADLPSLTLGGNAGRTYSRPPLFSGPSYGITLGLAVPIFNGFSHQYDVRAAQAQAAAISALADQARQNVITQVFVSYYALQTAEQRVVTADELLASAQQSEQVAAGRYREGVGSIIDLLTAQSALANARAQQVQSRWQWSTSLAQLARDAGVLSLRGDAPFTFSADTVLRSNSNPIR
jgi:outer membrane protein